MEISATELKDRLDKGEQIVILDIREPHELQIAKLDNTVHIPMGELESRVSELEEFKGKEIVVYCRTGNRSARCMHYLQSKGFEKTINLTGGIHAWSDDVDPEIMKY